MSFKPTVACFVNEMLNKTNVELVICIPKRAKANGQAVHYLKCIKTALHFCKCYIISIRNSYV